MTVAASTERGEERNNKVNKITMQTTNTETVTNNKSEYEVTCNKCYQTKTVIYACYQTFSNGMRHILICCQICGARHIPYVKGLSLTEETTKTKPRFRKNKLTNLYEPRKKKVDIQPKLL